MPAPHQVHAHPISSGGVNLAYGYNKNLPQALLMADIHNQSPLFWHSKPDFVNLLSHKYNDAGEELSQDDVNQNEENSCDDGKQDEPQDGADANEDDHEASQVSLLESKARGRHQSQAASLRISKIETILATRKDLTRQ